MSHKRIEEALWKAYVADKKAGRINTPEELNLRREAVRKQVYAQKAARQGAKKKAATARRRRLFRNLSLGGVRGLAVSRFPSKNWHKREIALAAMMISREVVKYIGEEFVRNLGRKAVLEFDRRKVIRAAQLRYEIANDMAHKMRARLKRVQARMEKGINLSEEIRMLEPTARLHLESMLPKIEAREALIEAAEEAAIAAGAAAAGCDPSELPAAQVPAPTASPVVVVEQPWPFEISREEARGQLVALGDRKASFFENVSWASENLHNPAATPAIAPSNSAWSLLMTYAFLDPKDQRQLFAMLQTAASKWEERSVDQKKILDDSHQRLERLERLGAAMEKVERKEESEKDKLRKQVEELEKRLSAVSSTTENERRNLHGQLPS